MIRRTTVAMIIVASVVAACGGSNRSAPSSPTTAQPVALAGTWNLQTHASASCATLLPADSRNRSYGTVTVTQTGNQATFTVLVAPGTLPLMFASVVGNQVSGSVNMIDGIPGSSLNVIGDFNGALSGSALTGTLNGAFISSGNGRSCIAADHQFIFSRR